MRTKTILLTAALSAVTAASTMAQVYSINVVGYVNSTWPAGFNMIANPLDSPTNTLNSLLPGMPTGSKFYKLKPSGVGFDVATKAGANWAGTTNVTLAPGDGGFLSTAAASSNTWVGTVLQGALANPYPAGFSIRASQVPQTATPEVLGLSTNTATGSKTYQYVNAAGTYSVRTDVGATYSAPTGTNSNLIKLDESFFLSSGTAGSWLRSFTVGP